MNILRVLIYIKGTIDDVLTLETADEWTLDWYVDAYFAVHTDTKSIHDLYFL